MYLKDILPKSINSNTNLQIYNYQNHYLKRICNLFSISYNINNFTNIEFNKNNIFISINLNEFSNLFETQSQYLKNIEIENILLKCLEINLKYSKNNLIIKSYDYLIEVLNILIVKYNDFPNDYKNKIKYMILDLEKKINNIKYENKIYINDYKKYTKEKISNKFFKIQLNKINIKNNLNIKYYLFLIKKNLNLNIFSKLNMSIFNNFSSSLNLNSNLSLINYQKILFYKKISLIKSNIKYNCKNLKEYYIFFEKQKDDIYKDINLILTLVNEFNNLNNNTYDFIELIEYLIYLYNNLFKLTNDYIKNHINYIQHIGINLLLKTTILNIEIK